MFFSSEIIRLNIKIFFYILILINFVACNKEVKKRDILKKDKFINTLIEIHKANGLIQVKNLQAKNNTKDSVSLYNYILKKENISRKKFRNTVDWYAVHYDEYLKVIDSVQSYFSKKQKELEIITKQERQAELEKKKRPDTTDLWNLKKDWKLPDDGKKNVIPFTIKTKKQGTYTLKAKIKIYPDDQSVNTRMTIFANYKDKSKDKNSNGTMVKDGKFNDFDVSITTNPEKELESISGWVLNHSKGTKQKHIEVKNISLKRYKSKIILK